MPYEYGIYVSCTILQTYLAYMQLGTLNAFNRDYSQLIGACNDVLAKKYRNTVFTFLLVIFSVILVLVIIILCVVNYKITIDPRYSCGFLFGALIIFLTMIENFGSFRTRIDSGFKYISFVILFELLSVAVGAYLLVHIGYYSIYLTAMASLIIGIFLYWKNSYSDIKLGIDKVLLKTILLSGLPLLINSLIWTVVNSIDKIVILLFLDTESLGLYGIAQNAFSYMILIPAAMSQLFYANMGKIFGTSNDVSKLNSVSITYTTIISMVTSVIAMVAFYLFPIFVQNVMPNYSEGIAAAQIMIIGLSVYAATMVNGNILTLLKKNAAIIRSSVYMCVLNIVCSIGFVIIIGKNIESVALGTAATYTIGSIIIIIQLKSYAGINIIKLINASILPVLIAVIPGVLLYQTQLNKLIGLFCTLLIAMVYYVIFYKKTIVGLINKT